MNVEKIENISHQNFQFNQQFIEQIGEDYFNAAVQDIQQALQDLYGEQEISFQQLFATIRRGDLISKL